MTQRNDKRTALLLLFIVAFSIVGYRVGFAVGSDAINNAVYQAGTQTSGYAYIVFKVGSTIYARNGLTGALDYTSSNFSYIVNTMIPIVQTTGGDILLKASTYTLSQKIYFPSSIKGGNTKTVGLVGETWSGAPIYIHDIDGIPYGATIIEPSDSYHGSLIQIGESTDSNYQGTSVKIENLVLSGIPVDSPKASRQGAENITMTADEAGIKGWNLEQCIIRNLAVFNCYYGMSFSTGSSATSDFVVFENLWFAYNIYHFSLLGQSYGINMNRVASYLSYRTGFIIGCIDGVFQNIISNADCYENTTYPESTFLIYSNGRQTYRDITIQNSKDAAYAGIRGIFVNVGATGSQALFDNILIQGVNGDAVRTGGTYCNGTIRFVHLMASPYPTQMYGGEGRNNGYGIKHYANNTDIFVEDSDLRNNVWGPWLGTTSNATLTNVRGYP